MNQTNEDVQQVLVHLHPIRTQNNIYSLTFQDNKTGREHSLDKLEWGFMDHPIDNHLTSRSANRIRYFNSPEL
jgi:hypothetical protein